MTIESYEEFAEQVVQGMMGMTSPLRPGNPHNLPADGAPFPRGAARFMLDLAEGGGALNDHYDDPALWTDAEVQRLAAYIPAQIKRDDEFLQSAQELILSTMGLPGDRGGDR